MAGGAHPCAAARTKLKRLEKEAEAKRLAALEKGCCGQVAACQAGQDLLARTQAPGHAAPLIMAFACSHVRATCAQVYDIAEFPALAEKYEKLNWRIISKPGGATVKPDEFYTLYGSGNPPPCGTWLSVAGAHGIAHRLHVWAKTCQAFMLLARVPDACGCVMLPCAKTKANTHVSRQ